MEVRGQSEGVRSLLLPRGSCGPNLTCQAQQQGPLPSVPSSDPAASNRDARLTCDRCIVTDRGWGNSLVFFFFFSFVLLGFYILNIGRCNPWRHLGVSMFRPQNQKV